MRHSLGFLAGLLLLVVGLEGQQLPTDKSPSKPPQATQAQLQQALEIYQIDLDPTGTAFALSKPVLEGDVYVFTVWPERTTVRLNKAKVKKITQRTKDLDKEVIYQIDLNPTGRMIAREQPELKATTFTFHTWREGTLMSLRQADVQRITRLTGIAAFKVEQELRGAALIDNLAMEGGGSVRILPGGPAAPAAAPTPAPGVVIYGGIAGVTEAFPSAPATVSSPGDVPKMPEPTPAPH
jgi:hypothetical protein